MRVEVVIEVKSQGPQLTYEVNPKTEDQDPKRENPDVLKSIKKRSQLSHPLRMLHLGRKTGPPAEDPVVVLKEEVCLQGHGTSHGGVGLHSSTTGGPSRANPLLGLCLQAEEQRAGP